MKETRKLHNSMNHGAGFMDLHADQLDIIRVA